MGIRTMFELLQNKEKEKIVILGIGSFYIAVGKDAILLNKILELKLTCLETGICKAGFPINSLEKYTKKIEENNYSYIVYKYNAQETRLEIEKIYKGKKINDITEIKLNCLICKGVKSYPKEDKYVLAVAKLYEEEDKNLREEKLKKEQKARRKIWYKKKNKQIN